jgi:hypothetical protein
LPGKRFSKIQHSRILNILVFYVYLAYDFKGWYPIAISVTLPRGIRPEGVIHDR